MDGAVMDGAARLDLVSSAAGYVGATAIIMGYFLNQGGWLRSEDWRFPAMNLIGSGLVLVSLLFHMNLPSLVIEIFWSSISVYGIWRNVRALRRTRR